MRLGELLTRRVRIAGCNALQILQEFIGPGIWYWYYMMMMVVAEGLTCSDEQV